MYSVICFVQRLVLNKSKYFISKLGRMLPITRGHLSEHPRTEGSNAVKHQILLGVGNRLNNTSYWFSTRQTIEVQLSNTVSSELM